jgi:hypothetical protein
MCFGSPTDRICTRVHQAFNPASPFGGKIISIEGEAFMKYEDARKQKIYEWFREHFVEPEVCDPSESPASGYQYSCGGPYFPKEIIHAQFSETYPKKVVDEVIKDLETESSEWAIRKVAV